MVYSFYMMRTLPGNGEQKYESLCYRTSTKEGATMWHSFNAEKIINSGQGGRMTAVTRGNICGETNYFGLPGADGTLPDTLQGITEHEQSQIFSDGLLQTMPGYTLYKYDGY